jgi:CRP/FNR family transcriptional regulator
MKTTPSALSLMLATDHARSDSTRWSGLCQVCTLLGIALPAPATGTEPLFLHRQLKPGQRLYREGEPFHALYLVNSGFLKTALVDEAGNERVLGFPMRGDVLAVDAIAVGSHPTEAVALTAADVVVLPFATLTAVTRQRAGLEDAIYRILGRELAREHASLGFIGTLGAEARVARFLGWLSDRFAALGFSGREFQLRMTRQEIGSYLGLTLETVSRALSALDAAGIVQIDQRHVRVLVPQALRTLTRLPAGQASKPPARRLPAKAVIPPAARYPGALHA